MNETSEASTPSTPSPAVTGEKCSSQATSQTGNPQSGTMATAPGNFSIPAPANFNFKTEDWNQWISPCELLEAATQRDGLPNKVRINTLISLWEIMPPTFIKALSCQVKETRTLTLNKSLKNTSRAKRL